jgi:uncharacterized membrane protein YgdD (TMEM256/DUF423 family)
MKKGINLMILGACLCALAVGLGAFGAHGLKKFTVIDTIHIYETATHYLLFHSLAIIIVGFLQYQWSISSLPARFFTAGIISFCGSLYVLVLGKIMGFGLGLFNIITPIGGLFFIVGWLYLAYSLWQYNKLKS